VTSFLKPFIFILESVWPVYPSTEPSRSDDSVEGFQSFHWSRQNHSRSPRVGLSRSPSIIPRFSMQASSRSTSNTQTSSPSVPRPSKQPTDLVCSNSSNTTDSQSSQSSGSRTLTDLPRPQSSSSGSLTDLPRLSFTQLQRPPDDGFKGLFFIILAFFLLKLLISGFQLWTLEFWKFTIFSEKMKAVGYWLLFKIKRLVED